MKIKFRLVDKIFLNSDWFPFDRDARLRELTVYIIYIIFKQTYESEKEKNKIEKIKEKH